MPAYSPTVIEWLVWVGLLPAGLVWWRGWQANRTTSLAPTFLWSALAWLCWIWAVMPATEGVVPSYLALCLTSCATMALLGARRPGVLAWNFVLLSLLAVDLLPVAELVLRPGGLTLGGPRLLFLGGTLAVGLCNYVGTRLTLAAVCLAIGCALELLVLLDVQVPMRPSHSIQVLAHCLVAVAPWLALLLARRSAQDPDSTAVDRLWLDFRDRFGLVWALRIREQLNRALANGGYQAQLGWDRLYSTAEPLDDHTVQAAYELLQSLLKRFGLYGS